MATCMGVCVRPWGQQKKTVKKNKENKKSQEKSQAWLEELAC